ncbi:MAG: peptidylprolyl isomerase [Candidatus Komeilibacteria bacterium]
MKKILLILMVIVLSGCTITTTDNTASTSSTGTTNNADNPLSVRDASDTTDNLLNNEAPEPIEEEKTTMILAPSEQPNLLSKYTKATLQTNMGDVVVEFYREDSPVTVNNFLYLAEQGVYNGTKFHRVIKSFMVQGGDPFSANDQGIPGTGGPGYKFDDEFNSHPLVQGSLAMANAGPNTNGSQFFIVTAASTPWLDGAHTNFGTVVDGLDVVMAIEDVPTGSSDKPLNDIVVNRIILE